MPVSHPPVRSTIRGHVGGAEQATRRLAACRTAGRTTSYDLTSKRLNDYVKIYLGEEFSAKDFRTWGGTLLAAIYFAEGMDRQGFPESEREQKRSSTSVMQRVAKQLGNTPAVTRESYVSPAVGEQYLEGRTIDDFRPRHLRIVKARDAVLLPEEQAMLSLLRSWRIRRAREAA